VGACGNLIKSVTLKPSPVILNEVKNLTEIFQALLQNDYLYLELSKGEGVKDFGTKDVGIYALSAVH
jgi:hypothetical protein